MENDIQNSDAPVAREAIPPSSSRQFGWPFWVAITGLALIAFVVIGLPYYIKSRGCGPRMNSCITNLKQIDGAVQQWALEHHKAGTNVVRLSGIVNFLKGSTMPVCPEFGAYAVSTVSAVPTCTMSAKGHSL